MKNRMLYSAIKNEGIMGGVAHISGRIFGSPKYIRPASTIDFRSAGLTPAASSLQFISLLLGIEDENLVSTTFTQAKAAINQIKKRETNYLPNPERWNSGLELQYILTTLVLILKPSVVVETGTANGASAAAIATALEINNFGHLWSFDIAQSELVLVPKELQSKITFVKVNGSPVDLKKEIAKIPFTRLGEKSIFLHDSDHSYFGQESDYLIASSIGFTYILSDDVDASLAFCNFANAKGIICFDPPKFIGGLRNSET